MGIRDLFSKRQKRLRGEMSDVYTYDSLPNPLRVQIIHIWEEAIGSGAFHHPEPDRLFMEVERTLCREYGKFRLTEGAGSRVSVANFFLNCEDTERCLDVVQVVFSAIERLVGPNRDGFYTATLRPEEAVAELNVRFREHGVGYEYRNGEIIRVDARLLHKEVVIPALELLQQRFLAGANAEFMSAHEHYRLKRYKECLVDCLKSFESTMKAICGKRRWTYQANWTAKPLIDLCIQKGLFPSFLDSHLAGLRTTLESGLPTTRNKLAGHGQGATPVEVPEEVASYALHLTAANILLFASCNAKLR